MCAPGGWAFQYNNAHYPDLDDTAVVVMALDRARERARARHEAIARGREWVEGLQSRNGGWGAFDADNPITTSTTFPSPIMARCSIRRRKMSPAAASACWRSWASRRIHRA